MSFIPLEEDDEEEESRTKSEGKLRNWKETYRNFIKNDHTKFYL